MNARLTTQFGLSWFAGLLAAVVLAACGGADSAGAADVSIDRIEPATTFPGVETTIAFSISPKGDLSEDNLSWEVDFGDGSSKKGDGAAGEVTYVWEESGQYPVEITAIADGSTVGVARRSLRVAAPVDLEVSNVRPQKANVDAGASTKVGVDIANLSATPVESSFTLQLFLTDKPSVEASAIGELTQIGEAEVAPPAEGEPVLGPSSTRDISVSADIPAETKAGDYHLVPFVDPDGDVADDAPDNNYTVSERILRVSTEAGVLPDLVVENVVPIPDRVFPSLNAFSRTYRLRNRGGGDANEVVTRTYLSIGDSELDDSDTLVSKRDKPVDVPAEESITVGPDRFVLDEDITPMSGEMKVWVIVEASMGEDSTDPNPDNNVGISDPAIVVSDKLADGPDVAVTDFSVSPRQTYLDGSLEVSLEVANQGNTDVSTFFCGLYLGSEARVNTESDPRFSSLSVTSLDSGKTVTIEQTVTVSTLYDPGTYHVYVVCDPAGSLEENFRNNNQRIYPKTVEITDQADVDLYVDSLQVPKNTQEEDTTTLTAKVCVTGSNASGQVRGELYQTIGTQVDFEADPLKTFTIPNVNPGDCADVPIKFEADCEDFEETYAYGVAVDTQDKLPEEDEDNNTRTGSNTMTIQGQYCACTEDMYEKNNGPRDAFSLNAGQTSAAVCDPGTCDFFKTLVEKGESLRVETTFNAEKGDLKTTLFDPSGVSALDSDTAADRQQVGTFVVPARGQYVYSVCGTESDSQNLYDVDVQVIQQVAGVDLIPRRVDVPAQDTFSIGETLSLSFRVNNIGKTGAPSFETAVMISPDRDLSDNDNVSLKPATTTVKAVGGAGKVDHTVDVTLPPSLMDGEYWIGVKVDPSKMLGEASYANNVAFSEKIEIKTRCYDVLEPNDSFNEARKVDSKSYSNLVACAAADDYYKLCVPDAKKFNISASFDDQKGDIDLELYDEHLNIVDSSAKTGVDNEKVSVDYVNGDQCYFMRAFVLTVQPQLETSYDLDVNVKDVDPALRCSSDYEPNNSFQTASSLVAGLQHSGSLDRCPASDTDFYRVQLNSGQTVSFRGIIDPKSQPGTLRLQLYRPNQKPSQNVETAPGVSTAELKDFTAPTGGQYYLQVTMTGNQRKATYRLEADGLGGIDLAARNLDFWPGTYGKGDPLLADFEMANLRTGTAQSPGYEVFLGDGRTLDPQNDTSLGTFTHGNLSGLSSTTLTPRTAMPSPLPPWAGMKQAYIHVKVSAASSQSDSNPTNNVATQPITLKP